MRLLRLEDNGEFSLVEHIGRDVPSYAILSHTWGADHEEVTFKDLAEGTGKSKVGYRKLTFCGRQAAKDNLRWFWVDTCCIDKSSSAELSEAINSMFCWYRKSAKCYVLLSDVSVDSFARNDHSLHKSRWFTRGWTLQELVAPTSVEFFSVEGERLGDKVSLLQEVHEITGISDQALQGSLLSHFSVDERMSWAERRETKREEDKAYSLLGIFDVSMPLIYGEGMDKAFRRLLEEIDKSSRADPPRPLHSEISSRNPASTNLTALAATQQRMQKQVSDMTEALDALRMGIERGSNACATVIFGSTVDASLSASEIFRFLEDLGKAYSASNTAKTARFSNAQWLQDQFNDIWADTQSAAAAQIRKRRRRKGSSRTGPEVLGAQSQASTNRPATGLQLEIDRKITSISRKRKAAVESSVIDVNLPVGNVRMIFTGHQQSGKMLGARLLYVPARHMQSNLKGIFATCLRDLRTPRLVRSLSTFQVVREGSEALEHIRQGNLQAIRHLLTSRQINPNDRDEDGDSLLLVSVNLALLLVWH
ncbi:HET-domain-containing protein [Lentithecium fluviatile CBS 122367]|uniref:HET-domain-containing protein n=1 Tax=Lentithecium fluviatile CBS 122367 TaxID=1168545 RepID=A0A6G1J7H5_9PLEO|nr:HET-domain-containing protein [Lentithecium fluviatile CBS 122367]